MTLQKYEVIRDDGALTVLICHTLSPQLKTSIGCTAVGLAADLGVKMWLTSCRAGEHAEVLQAIACDFQRQAALENEADYDTEPDSFSFEVSVVPFFYDNNDEDELEEEDGPPPLSLGGFHLELGLTSQRTGQKQTYALTVEVDGDFVDHSLVSLRVLVRETSATERREILEEQAARRRRSQLPGVSMPVLS